MKRVVYIATPHQGTHMADGWIGKLGSRLVRSPQQILQVLTSIATLDVAMLNPDRLSLRRLGARSIDTLSTKHPVIRALQTQPMKTPHHSVIGVKNQIGSPETSSRGVVPYHSSHLDTAVTETLVPHGHSCTRASETVNEVLRLVRAHVRAAQP